MESFLIALGMLSASPFNIQDFDVNTKNRDLFCSQVSSVHTRRMEEGDEYAVTFLNGKNTTITNRGFELAEEALKDGLFFCVSNTNPPIYSLSRSTNLR